MRTNQSIPEESCCPECGEPPSEDSIMRQNLSSLGYMHEDKFMECSACDNQWTIGIPHGQTDDDRWVCDACGGDFMPHFVYVYPERGETHVRPKCQDCYWVPDVPITLDSVVEDDRISVFLSHHAVTGDQEDAEPYPV